MIGGDWLEGAAAAKISPLERFDMTDFSALRLKAGLTEIEVSKLLGLPLSAIAMYESGEQRPAPNEIQSLRGLALVAQLTAPAQANGAKRVLSDVIGRCASDDPILSQLANKSESDAIPTILAELQSKGRMRATEIARAIDTSLVSVTRWLRGDNSPNPEMECKIRNLYQIVVTENAEHSDLRSNMTAFASRGARVKSNVPPLFRERRHVNLSAHTQLPLIQRLSTGDFWQDGEAAVQELLRHRGVSATTLHQPAASGIPSCEPVRGGRLSAPVQ